MIQRSDILSIPFLKKSVFTGSFQGMRYRLEKVEAEEAVSLRATIWEGPYSFDVASEEQKEAAEFPFSEDGICEATKWLNGKWQEQPDRWRKAQTNW